MRPCRQVLCSFISKNSISFLQIIEGWYFLLSEEIGRNKHLKVSSSTDVTTCNDEGQSLGQCKIPHATKKTRIYTSTPRHLDRTGIMDPKTADDTLPSLLSLNMLHATDNDYTLEPGHLRLSTQKPVATEMTNPDPLPGRRLPDKVQKVEFAENAVLTFFFLSRLKNRSSRKMPDKVFFQTCMEVADNAVQNFVSLFWLRSPSRRFRNTSSTMNTMIALYPAFLSLQVIVKRNTDGGFGFSVTGQVPVTVCSVQPSKLGIFLFPHQVTTPLKFNLDLRSLPCLIACVKIHPAQEPTISRYPVTGIKKKCIFEVILWENHVFFSIHERSKSDPEVGSRACPCNC